MYAEFIYQVGRGGKTLVLGTVAKRLPFRDITAQCPRSNLMASSSPGRKSTIYDVAKATGSSTATVSMVLNGSSARYRINEETANRILESAPQFVHMSNIKARALTVCVSGPLGVILA